LNLQFLFTKKRAFTFPANPALFAGDKQRCLLATNRLSLLNKICTMIRKSDIIHVIEYQKQKFKVIKNEIEREIISELPLGLINFVLIISGIRRCGKSTLLHQLIEKQKEPVFFLNFDTPKLFNFELKDFEIIDLIINENNYKVLFFDEIQVVNGWELYIRQKLDEGYQIFVTGSNASLLSQELGTKLTGRHITKELFPFSLHEYAQFKSLEINHIIVDEYLKDGGFPEYIRSGNPDVVQTLFNDILYRDIAVRYGIRDVESMKRLLIYLVSNVGKLVTAGKLVNALGIKSPATILDYFSYFEETYLLSLVPKFSYSYRAQMVNPRKIYIIDNGLVNAVSASFTDDFGRKLENGVYHFLRQRTKEIYYYNENDSECDFVVCNKNKAEGLIQVCYNLNRENIEREEKGLISAMDYFKLDKGTIITFNQKDIIKYSNKTIEVMPFHEYLNEKRR
jgi:uncharacterized protein